jgi:hypothetical protein
MVLAYAAEAAQGVRLFACNASQSVQPSSSSSDANQMRCGYTRRVMTKAQLPKIALTTTANVMNTTFMLFQMSPSFL